MKVLVVTAYGGWGSTGKIADGIAKTTEEHGHEAFLAYGFFYSSFPRQLKMKSGARYMNFYEILKCRLTGYMGFTSKRATQKLINWIEEVKPDVINLHNVHGGYVHIEMLFDYLKSCNMQIVWTMHDCWSFTGHCSHFQMVQCDRWKTGCHNCPDQKLKQSYPISYFFDQSEEQYRRKRIAFTNVPNLTIVSPSQWLADLIKESFLKDYPVRVIHNGIDLNVFKPTESNFRERYGIGERHIVLGVAFDWGSRKGLDVFLELTQRLDEQYQIVLVGTDDKTDKLLPDNVISIHRTQNQRELAEIYTAADVFANPTREDNFPTVNLEALACGTPVVTFRTGGSPECIDDSCGSVVDCDDIDSLEREVVRICNTKPYLTANCLKKAGSFGMDERFEEYVKLCEQKNKNNISK